MPNDPSAHRPLNLLYALDEINEITVEVQLGKSPSTYDVRACTLGSFLIKFKSGHSIFMLGS